MSTSDIIPLTKGKQGDLQKKLWALSHWRKYPMRRYKTDVLCCVIC